MLILFQQISQVEYSAVCQDVFSCKKIGIEIGSIKPKLDFPHILFG